MSEEKPKSLDLVEINPEIKEQLETIVMNWLRVHYRVNYDSWTSGVHRMFARDLIHELETYLLQLDKFPEVKDLGNFPIDDGMDD